MDQPKFSPVLTIRLLKRGAILTVPSKLQVAIDASVPRDLMLVILKQLVQMLEAGRSPEQIAQLRL